jgi:glycosyltransferase involved in cell wall biosynthesis
MSERRPLFSIVTPVYNTPLDVLETMVQSVLRQTFDDWEFLLVDDCSQDDRVREYLRGVAADDPRVTLIERSENGHIVVASNDAVNVARGEFIALLDHDDLLVPRALEHMARAIAHEPEVDYLYSDEDKVDQSGNFFDEFRKSAWSPEQLRGHMYTCHFSVLRTSVVHEVGGFHEGFEGSQDHDLVLRVTERARKIVHIPKILYHWRVIPGSAAGDPHAKPYAWVAGVKAVQAHLDRMGIDATVDFGPGQSTYRIVRKLDPAVRISVVIPTAGADGLVWGERRYYVVEAVRSLLEHAGHDNVEIVVVHDGHTPARALELLRKAAGRQLRLVRYDKAFDFSEKCNLGVLSSYGDVVVLLNDDIEVVSDDFLVQLVAPLYEDGVGMTGARLLYPDGRVQHGGLAVDKRLEHLLADGRAVHQGPFLVRETANFRVGRAVGGAAAQLRRRRPLPQGPARRVPAAVDGRPHGVPLRGAHPAAPGPAARGPHAQPALGPAQPRPLPSAPAREPAQGDRRRHGTGATAQATGALAVARSAFTAGQAQAVSLPQCRRCPGAPAAGRRFRP